MKVIDNNGVIYDSLRQCAKQLKISREYMAQDLKRKGIYINEGKKIQIRLLDGESFDNQPQEEDKLWTKIKEKYSEKELMLLSKGQGLQDPNLKYPHIELYGEHHKIGVISDGHLGSKYSPLEFHYTAFKTFEKENCECVLHCGDVVEGLNSKRAKTQIYELSHIGYKQQRDLAIEVFSHCKLPIYCISGNHDGWYSELGANVVEEICQCVPNMTYLGHDQADIQIGNATIRLFHGGDGSCFTEGTEILTKDNGWVDFKDLTKDMEVATMSKDGHLFEWQKPLEITNQPYCGDVYHFKNRKYDFSVTPNHRLWVKYNQSINKPLSHNVMPQKAHYKYDDKWHALTAKEIYDGWRKQKWIIPTTPDDYIQTDFTEYVDVPYMESKKLGTDKRMQHIGRLSIKDIAELIAWYVTEGCICNNRIAISQYKDVNPENYKSIQSLVDRMGVRHYDNNKSITIASKEFSNYILSICGSGSRNKYLPSFIKNNSKDVLKIVFTTMINGDGWIANKENEQYGYRSISRRLLSDFGEIAVKLGYSTSYHNDTISVSKIQITPSMVTKPQLEHYGGGIYCCSVPNELIYVRKNGKCFFSHNSYAISYRLQKLVESYTGGKKPNILLAGHVHKYCSLFDRMIHSVSVPCLQMQTPWMRGKKLPAHTGFLIIEFDTNKDGVCNFSVRFYPFYA